MQFCNLARKHFARRLFFAQRPGDFSQAQVQLFDRAVAVAQTGVEFAFAQRQDVGAQLEALFVEVGEAGAVALFQRCAALAFLERLHPQGFGDVGDAFGQAVQGRGAGVQSGREGFPPGIEHGVDGVGGAAADFAADFFDGGAFAQPEQGVGGVAHVRLGDAAGRRAEGSTRCGEFIHVVNNTLHVCRLICYPITIDNGTYH